MVTYYIETHQKSILEFHYNEWRQGDTDGSNDMHDLCKMLK